MYPLALVCGVSVHEYWDLTLQEIMDIIDTYEKQNRERIEEAFQAAEAVASRIIYFFSDPKSRREDQILQPWHVYPELYPEAIQMAEEKKEEDERKLLEDQKANMMLIAERWNRKFEGEQHGS